MNDLNPSMQARLEKWKAKLLKGKEPNHPSPRSPGSYVPRQMDYGDDIRDYELKEQAAWAYEVANNPTHNMYR